MDEDPSGTRRVFLGFRLAGFGACLPTVIFPNKRDRLLPGPTNVGIVVVAVLRRFVSQDAGIRACGVATEAQGHLVGAEVILLIAVAVVDEDPSGTRRAFPSLLRAIITARRPT